MNAKPIKIAATVVVLTLGFAGLLYSTLRDGTEYYKHVDEVMSEPAAWQGKRLQLHGFIVDGSILQKPDTLQYRFQVQNNGKIVQAEYTGIVPDGFKSGSEVVLKGRLQPAWLQRGAGRRDGEVPVEVHGRAAGAGHQGVAGHAMPSAPSSCSPASSSPRTRLPRRSPALAAARGGWSRAESARSTSSRR